MRSTIFSLLILGLLLFFFIKFIKYILGFFLFLFFLSFIRSLLRTRPAPIPPKQKESRGEVIKDIEIRVIDEAPAQDNTKLKQENI